MDILAYAARKSQSDLCTCITTTIPNTAFSAGCTAGAAQTNDGTLWTNNANTYSCYQFCGEKNILIEPWCTTNWATIPTLPGGNTSYAGNTGGVEYSGFKVCSTNLFGGACCQWTVPAGVTVARFQMWGAGAGAGSGCCCGGSTHGTTGAYASIIIPVVPGCQYTLCAGCACATPIIWSVRSGNAPASYVTGYGLCNLCAMGGAGVNHNTILSSDIGVYNCLRWTAPDCQPSSGACMCNSQGDFCFASSCASCGCIPFSASKSTLYYGCYTGALTSNTISLLYGSEVAGIPGLNGSHCFDTNFYGWYQHPPIYGFETVTQCCVVHTNGNACGGIFCNHVVANYMRYPGAGGTAVALFGGCTARCDSACCLGAGAASCGGDIGRSGMVCVTYY